MSTRVLLLLVGTLALVGCSKESGSTTAESDAAPPKPSASAMASTTAAPSASAPLASTVASAETIPSQADEAIAAAKEITKGNYKAELATIAATLK
jgi:uncharacterized lipoprotein YajG